MNLKCLHGLDRRFCGRCRERDERAPIPPDPIRSSLDGNGVLLLRHPTDGEAKVLTPGGLAMLREDHLQSEAHSWREHSLRAQLRTTAATRGFLFVPTRPLTWREQLDDVGPSHCYHCRSILSIDTGALGCSACGYYVCGCARCLCGYTGRNWKGELFSQFPPLPILREERLEYLRAFRYLTTA
jgi:hypothetical protein